MQPLVYRSSSFVNKKLRLIVSAPLLLGEIDFFDLDGNHLSSSIFFPREGLKKDIRNIDINGKDFDPKYHIVQLHANDEYIVGLNLNNYQSAIYENGSLSNQSILVFDWKGNPVKKFILDKQYFIKSFAVDWENSRFYGYCSEESEHNIIVYEFTNLTPNIGKTGHFVPAALTVSPEFNYTNAIGVPWFSKLSVIPDTIPDLIGTWLYFEYRDVETSDEELFKTIPPINCQGVYIPPSVNRYVITKIIDFK